jgi:hypothetical protein
MEAKMIMQTRRIAAAIVALACVPFTVNDAIAQQRQEPEKGRVPFQIFLAEFIEEVSQTSALFTVPFGRRLEIHNVTASLSLHSLPQEFRVGCVVRTPTFPGTPNIITAEMPLVMKRQFEPPANSDSPGSLDWHAMQPTLIHATSGQQVICAFERFPSLLFGSVSWTISGFTDDPK